MPHALLASLASASTLLERDDRTLWIPNPVPEGLQLQGHQEQPGLSRQDCRMS